jgi:deazaflavin-dependent oxidoreductase (nitroreductase family)
VNARDFFSKVFGGLHRAAFDLSKGRVGGHAFGMPVVKLTTIGRKSGKPRDTMLGTPVHDDTRVVLIASYGGAEHHPAWYLNLTANPDVTIVLEGHKRAMRARTATAEERADLWPKAVAVYDGYAKYQTKTDRDIPVVILEPAPA